MHSKSDGYQTLTRNPSARTRVLRSMVSRVLSRPSGVALSTWPISASCSASSACGTPTHAWRRWRNEAEVADRGGIEHVRADSTHPERSSCDAHAARPPMLAQHVLHYTMCANQCSHTIASRDTCSRRSTAKASPGGAFCTR